MIENDAHARRQARERLDFVRIADVAGSDLVPDPRGSHARQSALAGKHAIAFAIGFACLAAIAVEDATAGESGRNGSSGPKWSPWLEFGGYYSSEASRGEAAAFVPLWQSSASLFFADLRGKIFEDSVNEGNFALGYRQALQGWNLGAWAGYDRRRTTFGSVFNQVAGGIEALSADWDFRANVYLPVNREKIVSDTSVGGTAASVAIVGADILMTSGGTRTDTRVTEIAPWGVDAELGYRIPMLSPELNQELRIYGGGFYFDHDLLDKAVAGPKARIEWRFNDILPLAIGSRLTLEAEMRNDDVRGTDWELGARLRIPFAVERTNAALSPLDRRMTESLERDTDIVTQSKTRSTTVDVGPRTTEKVEDARTGVDFDRVATVDGTGNLQTTLNNAGGNSLIVASGTFNTATMVTLAADQTLMGSGGTISVKGLTTGTVANFTASGSTPTYNFTGTTVTEAAFALGSNNHVSGINMVGLDAAAANSQQNNAFKFAASNTPNAHLTNLDLHNFYGGFLRNRTFDGTNVNNVELSMNNVTARNDSRGASAQSVVLFGDNNTVNVTNSSFKNIRQGLEFTGDGNTVSFDNVAIASTNINVGALAVRGATAGGTSTLSVTNSSFDDLEGAAISSDTGTVNITFANSTINGVVGRSPFGVIIGTDASNWSMNNVTFSGQIQTGIRFGGANNVLSGTGNVSTATYGNTFCDPNGNAQTGSFGFTSPATTCP